MKTIESRAERLFLCFQRLASIGRDLQNLSDKGVTPALMESFNIIDSAAADRPSDGTLLHIIPANVKALHQKHYVDRAVDMLYFTVDLIESQISLLQRPRSGFSEETKAQIQQTMNTDAAVFTMLQKEIFNVLEAHKNDPLSAKENKVDAKEVHRLINGAHNNFVELVDDRYREEGEQIPVHPSIRGASKSDLLLRIFDSRMYMLDYTIDIFELKMRSAMADMVRYAQWDILRKDNPNLNNAPTRREMEKSWESAKAAFPKLMAGFHAMNGFFRDIVEIEPSSGELKPIKAHYVAVSVGSLPQITP